MNISRLLASSFLTLTLLSAGARGEDAAPLSAPLRLLPLPAGGWTMAGEDSVVTVPFYVDESAVGRTAKFQLARETAVADMPEASWLTAMVNGEAIGRSSLGASVTSSDFDIGPTVLKAGWNTLMLKANQRHRIDCSINGTYELWTRIDPARTGFILAPTSAGDGTLADIAAVSPDASGALPISLRVEPKSNTDLMNAGRLAAWLARLAGTSAPVVTIARTNGGEFGYDLAVGTTQQLAEAGIPEDVIGKALDGPVLVRGSDGRHALLVVNASTTGNVERALNELASTEARTRPPVTRPRPAGEADSTVTLQDLGVANEQFSGRLWQRGVTLTLPRDALIGDYANVDMRLSLGYAPDLDDDNGLSVLINGHLAAAFPFSSHYGGVINGHALQIPISAFRPGDNDVEFVAKVTAPTDRACSAQDQIQGPSRFLILGDTTFSIPTTAKAFRLPDLAATIAAGHADIADATPLRIVVGSRDPETVAAALTVAAKMATTSRQSPELGFGFALPQGDAEAAVLVGTSQDIARLTQDAAGWSDATSSVRAGDPATSNTAGSPLVGREQNHDQLLDDWKNRMESAAPRWSGIFGQFYAAGREVLAFFGGASDGGKIPSDAGFVVSQRTSSTSGAPITVVAAPTPDALMDGARQLVTPAGWQRLSGQAVWIEADTKRWRTLEPVDSRIYFGGNYSLWNIRLIIAAWLSLNSVFYTLIMLVLTALCGVFWYKILERHGAQTEA